MLLCLRNLQKKGSYSSFSEPTTHLVFTLFSEFSTAKRLFSNLLRYMLNYGGRRLNQYNEDDF